MMNRALKQQATELGPNLWQQQQGIAKYGKKFHIFIFLHYNKYTTGMQARSLIYCSPSLPKRSDCISLTRILWVLGALAANKRGQGMKLLTNHVM
jgi:hypothetical protein